MLAFPCIGSYEDAKDIHDFFIAGWATAFWKKRAKTEEEKRLAYEYDENPY